MADLLKWRKQFPALEQCVHLVSHSLGCMPKRAKEDVNEWLELWQTRSIDAWEEWLPEVDRMAARIERILSAPSGTVTVFTNVSSVQSAIASCFTYTPDRNKVVYSSLNFPTVSYVWKAQEQLGAKIVIVESDDGMTIDADKVCDAIDDTTLVVPISHALYGSSFVQDAKKICQKARSVGAHVILDCYQSVGTLPVDVVDLGVSFACGGSVKYLCGGPGAAFLYVRPDLIRQFEPRMTGWLAHESPFAFRMPEQSYADSIWRYMGGTPAVLALYQSRAGQEIIGNIGVRAIRNKSVAQTTRLIELVDDAGFTLKCPRDAERRGGSVVFDFVDAAEVTRELNRRKFYCDYRPGAGIRVSPHFYTKDEELELFFAEISNIRR